MNNTEKYGLYLAEALVSPVVDTAQYSLGIMVAETDIGKACTCSHLVQLER